MKAYMWRDVHGDWLYKVGNFKSVEQARTQKGLPVAYVSLEFPYRAPSARLSAAMDEARANIPGMLALRRQLPLAA